MFQSGSPVVTIHQSGERYPCEEEMYVKEPGIYGKSLTIPSILPLTLHCCLMKRKVNKKP